MPTTPSFTFSKSEPIRRAIFGGMSFPLVLSITFLILVFLLRIAAGIFSTIVTNRTISTQARVTELASSWPSELEESILSLPVQVNQVQSLLQSHIYGSNVFDFLRANILKNVSVKAVDVDRRNARMDLEVQAINFDALARQLVWLKSLPSLTRLTLSNVALGESGKVNFHLSIEFADSFFSVP